MRAHDVLGPGSVLSTLMARYEERPGQLAMAEAVEDALRSERPLLVEAGTGTGKTLAYLVPALLSGKRVVVSTATKALEEQIFTKDLPLVERILEAHGVTFRAALMKGLANYVCRRRLQERLSSPVPLDRSLVRISDWVKESETGDQAELTGVAEQASAWHEVHASSETRIGSGCDFFDTCFVTRMRREAEDAQLIVVNHHLFFADLSLRTGRASGGRDYASVIPAYDAVIFDEAHQIEEIATEFFGVRVSTARVEALVRDAGKAFDEAESVPSEARILPPLVSEAAGRFFAVFAKGGGRGVDLRRPLAPGDFEGEVAPLHGKLEAALEALLGHALRASGERAASVARRTRELHHDLRAIVRGVTATEDGEVSPTVAWLDVRDGRVALGASPVDVGPTLRTTLFERVPSVICTSATLTTSNESFHFARARLGAPPTVKELVVPSPFDVAARAAFYVPRDLPEPQAPDFERAAVERIVDLVAVTGGGAFVLCTSTRAMRSFHRALGSRLPQKLLVQGEAPKQELLRRFRADGHAVLVATMSFWEGVDVPGHALRLVILDKIPFAVPTDPVVAARSAQIEREGGNSFSQYAVPVAAITLKQGFGRLLRTQDDAGIVALLDRRAVTKGYGRILLASLPPARRVSSMDDVRAFWQSIDFAPVPELTLADPRSGGARVSGEVLGGSGA